MNNENDIVLTTVDNVKDQSNGFKYDLDSHSPILLEYNNNKILAPKSLY
jgi:hypothetical protein